MLMIISLKFNENRMKLKKLLLPQDLTRLTKARYSNRKSPVIIQIKYDQRQTGSPVSWKFNENRLKNEGEVRQ